MHTSKNLQIVTTTAAIAAASHSAIPNANALAKAPVVAIATRALAGQSHVAENPEHEWGEVVVLVGTSTAGKSTIISELLKQKPGMVEHGGDLAMVNIPLAYLKKEHPEDMAYLRRVIEPTKKDSSYSFDYILDYVCSGRKPNFKEGIPSEEQSRYESVIKKLQESVFKAIPPENINSLMMDEILIASKRGDPVVFDILNVNDVAQHALGMEHPSIKLALVYVPFQTLAERVIIRNNEAVAAHKFEDVRPGLFPLEQFTELFRPAKNPDDQVVQILTLREVDHAIDTVFESGLSFLKEHDPELLAGRDPQQEKAASRRKILEKFGFSEGDDPDKVVALTPSYKGYHTLINTAQKGKSKSEAAQDAVSQILSKKTAATETAKEN